MLVWIFWLTLDCFPKKTSQHSNCQQSLTGLWLSQLGPCIKDQIKLRLEPSWQMMQMSTRKNDNGLESVLEHTAFECSPRLRWCFQISFLWSLSIIIFKTGKLIRIFYRIDVNGINEFSKLSKFTVTKKRFLYFPLQLAEHSNCFLRRCVGASRPLSQPFWLAHPWCSQNLMSAYPLVTFVPHLHLVSGCFPVFTKVSLPKKNWTPPNFRIHLRSNLKDSV